MSDLRDRPTTATGRALLMNPRQFCADFELVGRTALVDTILAIENEAVVGLKERDAAAEAAVLTAPQDFGEQPAYPGSKLPKELAHLAVREKKFRSVTHQAAELMRSGCPEEAAFFWAGAIAEGVRSAVLLNEARELLALRPHGHVGPDEISWFTHTNISHAEGAECIVCDFLDRSAGLRPPTSLKATGLDVERLRAALAKVYGPASEEADAIANAYDSEPVKSA